MPEAITLAALLESLASGLTPEEILSAAVKADVAVQITDWRMQHGMNQADLAHVMGVSQPTISKWENGGYNFTIEKLAEIACKLDLNLIIEFSPAESTEETQTDADISDFYVMDSNPNVSVSASLLASAT